MSDLYSSYFCSVLSLCELLKELSAPCAGFEGVGMDTADPIAPLDLGNMPPSYSSLRLYLPFFPYALWCWDMV